MTLDYEVVLPLMLACVTAHYVASIYRRGESVYTRALRTGAAGDGDEWRLRQITALVRPPGLVLQRDERLAGVLERLKPRGDYSIYVVDAQNQLVGQVATQELRRVARAQPVDAHLTVAVIMQPAPPVLIPEMLLGDALDVFIANRCKQLPVVSGHWSPVLLGEVLRHDLLLALQDRIAERSASAAR
jgi:CIC family chloride channel protein